MLLDKKRRHYHVCVCLHLLLSMHFISAFIWSFLPFIVHPSMTPNKHWQEKWHLIVSQCSKITRRPAKGKTGGTCFFATVFPRWSCGGSCVIGDLINRWICCIAIPGRALLPEQPHHKHCRLMVGNYDLLVATCARTDCWINFELSVGVAQCEQ